MFDANKTITDAFIGHLLRALQESFPGSDPAIAGAVERATRTALETLANCDCPYHDLEHTLLVTDAGLAILRGRQIRNGDLTARDWLQAVVAMLFHDIGYVRGLLQEDREDDCVIDAVGRRVRMPPTATDAAMAPFHVTRGCLYISDRFANDAVIDARAVSSYIEMTRFPVPNEPHYQQTDSIAALVRAADLIGQMADPAYPIKQAHLFAEFQETGEARRLGLSSAAELRATFPAFFENQVYPYITSALDYLGLSREGRLWRANLYNHVNGNGPKTIAERFSQWPERPETTLQTTEPDTSARLIEQAAPTQADATPLARH